ncbi:MAG: hypothetical protein U5K53_09535 [Halanaerobiales bacterium]|nr:hypothetical protein [Halanaerobiales bacterium]
MLISGYSETVIIIIGLSAGIFIGLLVGLINGIFITRLNILPLIATLGTLGIAKGATFLFSSVSIAEIPEPLGNFANTVLGGFLPIRVLITLIIVVIFYLLLHKTRFGKYTYAIGSNEDAARFSWN